MDSYWAAWTSDTRTRYVVCEECDTEFIYKLEVTGHGDSQWSWSWWSSTQLEVAKKNARKDLQDKLKHGCHALPCPECAHVQDHMIPQAKADFAGKFYLVAGILAVAALILGVVVHYAASRVAGLQAGIGGLVLAGLVAAAGFLISQAHNPNSTSKDKRLRIAEEKCFRREDFESEFADNDALGFERKLKALRKRKNLDFQEEQDFAVHFWADRFQVRDGESRQVTLPTNEVVRIRLEEGMKTGEQFDVSRNVDGMKIRFVCTLNVYTETREKR